MFMHTGEHTLPASQHCSSVCWCEELYARLLSLVLSICFLLGPWKRLLGCPVRCPYNVPMQCYWFHCVQHTGRALMCRVVDARLFRTTGRSSSGRDRGERQTEADCGRLTRATHSKTRSSRGRSNWGPHPQMFFYNKSPLSIRLLLCHVFMSKSKRELNKP